MSQNGPYSGPPWSHGNSDEPYGEPSDPWGEHGSTPPVPEQASWGGHPPSIPQQPVGLHSAPMSAPMGPPVSSAGVGSSWESPPPVPPKRNTPIIVLVVTLGLLIVVGLGATAWLLKERRNTPLAGPTASATTAVPGAAPQGSEDARFNVKKGDCVINEGTDEEPNMRATPCTSGSYEVLARIPGTTTGEKDAERKCSKVGGYTKWFFYDSPFDELDFVLCLKEHKEL